MFTRLAQKSGEVRKKVACKKSCHERCVATVVTMLQCYMLHVTLRLNALRPSALRREGGEGRGRPWQEGRRATGVASRREGGEGRGRPWQEGRRATGVASRREGGEGRGRPWQEGRRAAGVALAGGRQGSWRGSVKTCLSLWFSPFGARCSSLFFYFLTW